MDGRPLPAAKALAGQTGMVDTLDDRGIRVAAAYAAVGNGLAMTVHQDTAQLYGEIRQAFDTSLLLMLFIAACGATMLHLQLTPLTTRMVESEARLADLARVDSLTGLPNRYAMNERMHAAIHRRRRTGKGVAIMFLDVDHFKTFNDTLGHAAGDAVLKEFAARLRLGVRVTDTVARLAGDEFVIIAEDLSEMKEAEIIARAILEKVRAPWQIAGTDLKITTSIGMAYFSEDEVSPEKMLASADAALYVAKANGRDGFAWGPNAQVLESVPA
jgi:diguanylate cyclase (GGDEF)-like protein